MTTIPASAEENESGIVLLAFDYPGACGWGTTEDEALTRLRSDLAFTAEWLADHGISAKSTALDPSTVDVDIVERVLATGDPTQCDSEGFFAADRDPYGDGDVSRTRELLEASRGDLLALVGPLDAASVDRRLIDGRRTVREILDHVAVAEHWYLTRADPPHEVPNSWRDYPTETFERLGAVRTDVDASLRSLVDVPREARGRERVLDGERWSVRKVLRRLVWHELLHYKQLVRLVPKVTESEPE